MAETSYFYIDQPTWDAWVDALGFASASKLAGACAQFYFTGELTDDVKLAKVAKALFEGERARLEARRSKASAKAAAKVAKATPETPSNVEKSGGDRTNPGKSAKKSEKKSGRVAANSAPTRRVPAETTDHTKPKPKPNTPLTPRAEHGGRGSGGWGSGSVTPAEYADMLEAGLGYDSPTAYGMGGAAVVGG